MKNKTEVTYIIGEIGQNHNGSVDIAKQLIDIAAQPVLDPLFNRELTKMNAIKLTKRDLTEELTASAMQRPYDSPHSFGKTYGAHRQYLELADEEHHELYLYAKSKGLQFVETLCAVKCVDLVKLFTPDRLKVASRDLTNLPLLEAMAETNIPIILSTGMGGEKEIDEAVSVISKHHEQIAILHCLSQYPAEYSHINLKTIHYLAKRYPQYTIGYSDHSIGIMAPIAAVALGATIIEKHITLDRNMKGSDHQGSLGPDGIYRLVRDIRNLESSLGQEAIFIEEVVKDTQIKLERSIASNCLIKKGETIREEYLHLLSPGDGLKWSQKSEIIGKIATEDISANEIIYPKMFQ
ncbi:N-acetylneuraminate synthase family protein [Fulvivirgaceae bacterium BMA12]|uniref:N-acetylneuraminate synthase family protein n=1 Tax=Agaribacillus aureus TaxID=3051825 RepID=A0ABT8LAF0_9BACT|nr:N-acetylneuraminate synthase family protein [Fulvivirgaceae bacterium BMA12]